MRALAVAVLLVAQNIHAAPGGASGSDEVLAELVGPGIASRGKLLAGVELDMPRARIAPKMTARIAAFERDTGAQVTLGLDEATVDSVMVVVDADPASLLSRLEGRWGPGVVDGPRSVWLDPATRTQFSLERGDDRATLTWQRYVALEDLIAGRAELVRPAATIGMSAAELRRQVARFAPGAVSSVSDANVLLWRLPALVVSADRMDAIASLEKGRVHDLKLHATNVRAADLEALRRELTRRFGKSHIEPGILELWHAGSVDISVDYGNGSMAIYVGRRQ